MSPSTKKMVPNDTSYDFMFIFNNNYMPILHGLSDIGHKSFDMHFSVSNITIAQCRLELIVRTSAEKTSQKSICLSISDLCTCLHERESASIILQTFPLEYS